METAPTETAPKNIPTLPGLARAFLLIGTFAFGGQGGLLALLNRDLVERRGWVSESDVAEAFTYVQVLPGAVVVQVVAYLGWKLRRGWGTLVATLAFLLPSVLTMLLVGVVYQQLAKQAGVGAALGGLTAAVVGLIAVATWKQGRKTVTTWLALSTAVTVCAVSLRWHLNPALLVIAAGLLGVIREAIKGGKETP
jgi:chromate transporter